jgi:hypothetical protein
MKPIRINEELQKQFEDMEKKKQYTTMNANMKSKFVGYSNDYEKSYFLRADYFKDESLGRAPQEYWSVPNPNTVYYTDCRTWMQNIKDLIEIENKMGIKSSNEYYLKEKKKRYDFLIQSRKISQVEFEERMANERIQLVTRE